MTPTWSAPAIVEIPQKDSATVLIHDLLERTSFQRECDGGGANQQLGIAWSLAPDTARDALEDAFYRGAPVCESDIERRLLPWLLFECAKYSNWEPRLLLSTELHLLKEGRIAVVPQCEFGKYRVDFAMAARRKWMIRFYIVECDGQEFHTSAQQIRDDKKRERTIKSNCNVIGFDRVTGSRIWKDAAGHAALIARRNLLAWRGLE